MNSVVRITVPREATRLMAVPRQAGDFPFNQAAKFSEHGRAGRAEANNAANGWARNWGSELGRARF